MKAPADVGTTLDTDICRPSVIAAGVPLTAKIVEYEGELAFLTWLNTIHLGAELPGNVDSGAFCPDSPVTVQRSNTVFWGGEPASCSRVTVSTIDNVL